MAKKATPEQRDFFISRSFQYEVWMMREAHQRLLSPPRDRILINALIESFCVHARNLIEFFKSKRDCDFDPRWFTTGGYQLRTRFVGEPVLSRINAQIAHLSRNRTAVASEKIGGTERMQIIAAIEGEVDRFHRHLAAEYLPKWRPIGQRHVLGLGLDGATTGTPGEVIGGAALTGS